MKELETSKLKFIHPTKMKDEWNYNSLYKYISEINTKEEEV